MVRRLPRQVLDIRGVVHAALHRHLHARVDVQRRLLDLLWRPRHAPGGSQHLSFRVTLI